ncbi:MAG: S41 family peptidase [Bacteroidota bacterium]|nr:S41 family peptidase [Bacteroidota bacterium]
MKKIKIFISIVIAAVLLVSTVAFIDSKPKGDFEIAKNLELYHSAIKNLRMYYVDDVEYAKLIKESLVELLKKLDPYTVYYSEAQMENYAFISTGAYAGIGITVVERFGKLYITDVKQNSPAKKHGIQIGDIITEIEGVELNRQSIEDLRKKLNGAVGSDTNIKLIRPYEGNKEIEILLKKEKIKQPAVEYNTMLSDGIVYIKLRSFTQHSAKSFTDSLANYKSSVKGVVIDLRGNPGGFLQEAVNILDYFTQKGELLVKTKGRIEKWSAVFRSKHEPQMPDIPVAVIVNSSSASASEIIAGTFQDLDRAVIIGERTFGKGLVQTTKGLGYNTKIKLTAAKYYLPGGRCVQVRDYSHLRNDGSVSKIPDSLKKMFKTKNGRVVYDGGGVKPDIEMINAEDNSILSVLIQRFIIYDYVMKYRETHKTISTPKEFKFKSYDEFKLFVQQAGLADYLKPVQELKKIKTQQQELYPELSEDIEQAVVEFKNSIPNLLDIHAAAITFQIEKEILSGYYGPEAENTWIVKKDPTVKKAVQILSNGKQYNQILNIQ